VGMVVEYILNLRGRDGMGEKNRFWKYVERIGNLFNIGWPVYFILKGINSFLQKVRFKVNPSSVLEWIILVLATIGLVIGGFNIIMNIRKKRKSLGILQVAKKSFHRGVLWRESPLPPVSLQPMDLPRMRQEYAIKYLEKKNKTNQFIYEVLNEHWTPNIYDGIKTEVILREVRIKVGGMGAREDNNLLSEGELAQLLRELVDKGIVEHLDPDSYRLKKNHA